jgi:hypothetical protein
MGINTVGTRSIWLLGAGSLMLISKLLSADFIKIFVADGMMGLD